MKHPREAWIDAGITLLREGRFDALKVPSLCDRLRVTKGAFYHHFESLDVYHAGLLEHWQTTHTQAPIDVADRQSTTARRDALYRAVGGLDAKLERAIRAWATIDRAARRVCEKVDARRIAYLVDLWVADGATAPRARVLGQLEYTIWLGGLMLPSATLRRNKSPYELVRELSGE